jgi:hypothetical protein
MERRPVSITFPFLAIDWNGHRQYEVGVSQNSFDVMGIPIGAIIVGSFAIIWTAAGASNMARRWLLLAVSSSVLISAVLIVAAWHIEPGQPVQFNLKAYNISVAFEAILIAITVIALTRTGRKFLLLPAISIIAGLHFYGMTWAIGSNEYWWIGTAMWLLPIVTLSFLPRHVWTPVVGWGCALILWASIIWTFF